MKYKQQFNQQPALRFRQFTRKRWALFACLGRVVTISVLSVATLKSASALIACSCQLLILNIINLGTKV